VAAEGWLRIGVNKEAAQQQDQKSSQPPRI
jgi:hypothetical protein